MAANSEHIIGLLERYSGGQATAGEIDQLFTLLRSGDYDDTVVSFIETRLQTFEPDNAEDIAFWQSRLEGGAHRITGGTATENHSAVAELPVDARPVHRLHFMRKWGWAAAAIIVLGVGAYLWNAGIQKTEPAVTATPAEILPGKNGAVLTLADGSQIVLDSLGNGVVADQKGSQVILQDGKLTYKPLPIADSRLTYNTMTTPKGRQFRVTLPDGTGVWLNAASSISYPTVFAGNERKVTITGEVYFEVVKNAKMPFKVNVNNKTEVEVLGTHFNVKAYDNENAIRTTLLEGAVKVNKSAMLKPGQQAELSRTNSQLTIHHSPDLDKVMAWKNGLFNFEGVSLAEVMRQLERWYDIEVTYEKGVPAVEFEGKMTRDVPLNDLLKMLERSDIHFRIDGRTLIVLP